MKTLLINPKIHFKNRPEKGAALVVVLVLLVLMLGVVLAFFSQSTLQRQVSKSSASQTGAELTADGAVNQIIGDLKREIYENSFEEKVNVGGGTQVSIYWPKAYKYAVPLAVDPVGTLPNLVKKSTSSFDFADGVPKRAVAVSTNPSTNSSSNVRPITPARWNKPLLMPATDLTNLTPAGFTAPDWILVDRAGNNPNVWSDDLKWSPAASKQTAVVGRYAYTIYNEGGLLDANVAGYPNNPNIKGVISGMDYIKEQTKYKSALSYADLTQIPGVTQPIIDALAQWRNSSTLGTSPAASYFKFSSQNPNNFITVSNPPATGGTDHMFVSRQQLINFFMNQLGGGKPLQDALQYFGTFSRSLNQPSLYPVYDTGSNPNRLKVTGPAFTDATKSPKNVYSASATKGGNSGFGLDSTINPPFRKIRVLKSFERLDGSQAIVGEPLVKKRFALNRLCWITYKGPSHDLPTSDPLYEELIKYGVSEKLLQEGTSDNILKYFGLEWQPPTSTATGGYWKYAKSISSTIATLDKVASANREPNFFEILKAGINVGSIARGRSEGGETSEETGGVCAWQVKRDTRVDFQVLQIGANIIDAASPDGFATNIVFVDDSASPAVPWPFWGRVDLPYLVLLGNVAIVETPPIPAPPTDGSPVPGTNADISGTGKTPGKGVILAVPVIWNPNQSRDSKAPKLNAKLVPSELRICIARYPLDQVQAGRGIAFNYSLGARWSKDDSGNTTFDSPGGSTNAPWTGATYDGSGTNPTGRMIYPKNYSSSIKFTDGDVFREPTPLWRMNRPTDPTSAKVPQISSSNTNIPADGFLEGGPNGGVNRFTGFYIGTYAIRVAGLDKNDSNKSKIFTMNQIAISHDNYGLQLSLEYKDVNEEWVPYSQTSIFGIFSFFRCPYDYVASSYNFYNRPALKSWGVTTSAPRGDPLGSGNPITDPMGGNWLFNLQGFDPRAGARWTTPKDYPYHTNGNTSQRNPANLFRYIDPTGNDSDKISIYSVRPGSVLDQVYRNYSIGASSTNNAKQNGYYTDPDGVVRRAMGAYATGAIGYPMATPPMADSNPVVLNRPFRSVAELGYVFRDTPWRNLDFSTPESGDAPLLDVFCINEAENSDALTAGKVDLNTRQPLVIQSILAGAFRDEFGTGSTDTIDRSKAETLAQALVDRTTSVSANKGPLTNISEIVGRYVPSGYTDPASGQKFDGFSADLASVGSSNKYDAIPRFREAAIRALSDTGMAGTWNLLIDVVAQTGRYASGASGLENFNVEGEKRLWVHVAIDRQTGKVVDQQIENVTE